MTVCFCTLAIYPPYRQRAQRLCADATTAPGIVLTDEPDDTVGSCESDIVSLFLNDEC